MGRRSVAGREKPPIGWLLMCCVLTIAVPVQAHWFDVILHSLLSRPIPLSTHIEQWRLLVATRRPVLQRLLRRRLRPLLRIVLRTLARIRHQLAKLTRTSAGRRLGVLQILRLVKRLEEGRVQLLHRLLTSRLARPIYLPQEIPTALMRLRPIVLQSLIWRRVGATLPILTLGLLQLKFACPVLARLVRQPLVSPVQMPQFLLNAQLPNVHCSNTVPVYFGRNTSASF